MTKGAQKYISQQSHLISAINLFLFLFRSDFLFFFFSLGWGESSSSNDGLQAETEQKGNFDPQSTYGKWNVKSQLEKLGRVKRKCPGALNTAVFHILFLLFMAF